MRPGGLLFAAISVGFVLTFVPSVGSAATDHVKWSIQQSPNPPGAVSAGLRAVSCASPDSRFCMAVGDSSSSAGPLVPLAEVTNGAGWTIAGTHAPPGASASDLTGVSCVDVFHCMAVGFAVRPTARVRALVERWDGSRWRMSKTPRLPRSSWSELVAVSCTDARDCIAVGGYIPNSIDAQERPLAERWNGRTWTVDHVPNPRAENGSALTGVSCSSGDVCEAVGEYAFADVDQIVIAFGRSAGGWVRQHQPNPNQSEVTSEGSVSCVGSGACTGVGNWIDRVGRTRALAERWDGSSWVRQHARNPAGFAVSELSGVSCRGATWCAGVGSWSDGFNGIPSFTLAERWNGAAWRIESTPNPPGATLSSLNAVDRGGPFCVAVGSWYDGSLTSTLVEVSRASG